MASPQQPRGGHGVRREIRNKTRHTQGVGAWAAPQVRAVPRNSVWWGRGWGVPRWGRAVVIEAPWASLV